MITSGITPLRTDLTGAITASRQGEGQPGSRPRRPRAARKRQFAHGRAIWIVLVLCLRLGAQTGAVSAGADEVVELADTPVFRAETVSRSMQAINYERTGGSTRVNFVGTALHPKAKGQARVAQNRSVMDVEFDVRNLPPATKFGAEYLTYVAWAVTPDGRAANLGEILLNKSGKGKLSVTTELQIFGLIVTAEPYFAVRQPSDVIVMQK